MNYQKLIVTIALTVISITLAVYQVEPVVEPQIRFIEAPSILWQELDHRVENGIIEYEVLYKYRSFCELAEEAKRDLPYNSTARKGYERLKMRCDETFNESWLTILNDLVKASKDRLNPRKKRVVWFIPILVFIAVVAIVGTGGAVVYHESRINKLEADLEKERTRNDIQFLANQKSQELHEDNARFLESLANRSEINRINIEELAIRGADIAWLSTTIHEKIITGGKRLSAILDQFQRGRLATKEMSELLNLTELAQHDPSNTKFESVIRRSENTVVFSFSVMTAAEDTKVFYLRSFPRWVNISDDPVKLIYAGPKYILRMRQRTAQRV